MDIVTTLYNVSNEKIFFILLAFSLILSIGKRLFMMKKCYNYMIVAFLFLYVIFIFYITLFSRLNTESAGDYSLIPFHSYYLAAHGMKEMIRESILNILFFYPLGYLFASLNIEKINSKRWIIIPIACALSLIIELSQYIFKLGYAEVDDVIHNTLGCAIGLLMCILLEKLFKIIKKQKS